MLLFLEVLLDYLEEESSGDRNPKSKQKKYNLDFLIKFMANHIIQIIGLKKEADLPVLKTIGLVDVEDKNFVVFNPCSIEMKNLHWTYHEDGFFSFKNKGVISLPNQSTPIEEIKQDFNLLTLRSNLDLERNIDYDLRGDKQGLFLVDLTHFKKGITLSISFSDEHHIYDVAKYYNDLPQHQCFIYIKSDPKIVFHVWDN
jgi:hypothetical protein